MPAPGSAVGCAAGGQGSCSAGAGCPVGEGGGCCRRDRSSSQAGGGAQRLAWAPAVPAAAVVAALRTAWRWAASVCSAPGERRLAWAASPRVWPTRWSLVPSGFCSSPSPPDQHLCRSLTGTSRLLLSGSPGKNLLLAVCLVRPTRREGGKSKNEPVSKGTDCPSVDIDWDC